MVGSEQRASEFVDWAEETFSILLPESFLISSFKSKMLAERPGGPAKMAINFALKTTDELTQQVVGPFRPLVRRAVLKRQLTKAEKYFRSLSDFYEL